ncbi:MAG: DNA gyrase subunit A [Pseudomonadota bacterium]
MSDVVNPSGDGPGSPGPRDPGVEPVTIEEEMKRSYLDYAMSVIVSRALPDVRDGLKPVHRRILYTMKEQGYDWNRAYRKSARIIGDVMGQFHPHGDAPIYDAMVRMAQPWSMRVRLIDGQGNFGSIDGDPPAAMRYTEARLERVASEALLADIDEDTVEFQPNYDETTKEPTVLPARLPNLLVNGANGIAVGMATSIPPHNPGEVIDACCALLDDPDASVEDLMQHLPGPDLPTGGIIVGRAGILSAYRQGRGTIVVRGRAEVEPRAGDRESIVITEIPFQLTKTRLLERIGEVVREKIIEGISDLRDESDRQGLRVVVELKRDAQSDVVLNQLYQHTPLQTSIGISLLAIDGRRPLVFSLREVLQAFLQFREEVVTRRTAFRLGKARDRAHVLVGLAIAVANIDEVVALIRRAPNPEVARNGLMERAWPAGDIAPLVRLIDEPGHEVAADGTYRLSEIQARAILDLRLQRLTGLERDKIAEELEALAAEIREYLEILASRARLLAIVRDELVALKERYDDPRRTTLEEGEADTDIEDLIQREDMVVTLSAAGYIKRVPLSAYRAQRRGGKGRSGMSTRDEDLVSGLFACSTHTPVLFFSSRGKAYKLKVYRLPIGSPQARGKALVNLLPLEAGETITATLPLPEDETEWGNLQVVFATSSGTVRRNRLSDFANVRANGLIAMKLEDRDTKLIGVALCSEDQDVMLASARGKAIRFRATDIRLFAGRDSTGVRGIRLESGDRVIDLAILNPVDATAEERDAYLRAATLRRRSEEEEAGAAPAEGGFPAERFAELEAQEQLLLSISSDGVGRRASAYDYRVTGRGGQGISNLDLSRPGGQSVEVVATFPIERGDQILLVTNGGQLIRCPVEDIRIAGRATRGVRIFDVARDEQVVSVSRLAEDEATGEEDAELEGDPTPDDETAT